MRLQQIIYTAIGLTASFVSFGQQDTIRTENIEIVKEYTPFVEDGNKETFQPVLPEIQPAQKGNLNYNLPSEFVETQYEPDELQPLPFTDLDEKSVRSVYVKGGYGTNENPLLKFALNALENDNYTVGARGGFHALSGDLIEQEMSETHLEVFGTKEITGATLNASIGYERLSNQLFGFDQALFEPTANVDLQKRYNIVDANFGLESASTDLWSIRHNTQINGHILNENLAGFDENQIGIETTISKRLFEGLDAKLLAGIATRNSKNESITTNGLEEQNETLVNITPIFEPTVNGIKLALGASINNDDANDTRIFPHINVEIPLSNDTYTFFAGWTGRTIMNSYRELQGINPWLGDQVFTRNYTKEIRTPVGIRGNVNEQFSFSASVSQEVSRNAILWTNTDQANQAAFQSNSFFQPRFEERLTTWKPEVNGNFQLGESVGIVADIAYNIYDTEQFEVTYLPELEAELDLQVKPIEQLTINGGIQALTGIESVSLDGVTEDLDNIFNANLGAAFDLNDQFAIFLDANNLTNNQFERWRNYPVVGTNILGGIVFSLN